MDGPSSSSNLENVECRRAQIVLLTEHKLDITIQPRLLVSELLEIVASHCQLKQPDIAHFGITYNSTDGEQFWLGSDKRVLDHAELAGKRGSTIVLFHVLRCYPTCVTQLYLPATVELVFLQLVKSLPTLDLFRHSPHDDRTLNLCSLALQGCCGAFTDEQSTLRFMKHRGLILRNKSTPADYVWEDSLIDRYKALSTKTRSAAVVEFIEAMQSLPTYGLHLFTVADKSGTPLLLGLSCRAILIFDSADRVTPRRVFHWKNLENMYYRDKKFTIEVNDPKRVVHSVSSQGSLFENALRDSNASSSIDDLQEALADDHTQVSVSRRAFAPACVRTHVFVCSSASQCNSVWDCAIAHHQFSSKRSCSQSSQQRARSSLLQQLDNSSLTLVSQLCSSSSDLGSSVSAQSVHSEDGNEDEGISTTMENLVLLKTRKQELENYLLEKMHAMRDVCMKEGALTGVLPPELDRVLAPGEARPAVRRRVGTAFALDAPDCSKAGRIAELELELATQRQIAAAAWRLSNDCTEMGKQARKRRKQDYEAAVQKVNEMENRLRQFRLSSSNQDVTRVNSIDSAVVPDFDDVPMYARKQSQKQKLDSSNFPQKSADSSYTPRIARKLRINTSRPFLPTKSAPASPTSSCNSNQTSPSKTVWPPSGKRCKIQAQDSGSSLLPSTVRRGSSTSSPTSEDRIDALLERLSRLDSPTNPPPLPLGRHISSPTFPTHSRTDSFYRATRPHESPLEQYSARYRNLAHGSARDRHSTVTSGSGASHSTHSQDDTTDTPSRPHFRVTVSATTSPEKPPPPRPVRTATMV